MDTNEIALIQNQLIDRKIRLEKAISSQNKIPKLVDLLREVDAALERIDKGTYGKCIICSGSIEPDRLLADPLITVCLDDLDSRQQKFLEQDLELASQIQNTLLPKNNIHLNGYEISYYYMPAGPVSGDYCDLVVSKNGDGNLYIIIGDITGKGIAASMLVNHVYAIFHSLMELNLPLADLMVKANRLFCESSLYTHFATLVCARAHDNGNIEISNAGHCLPVLIGANGIKNIESTGLPLGLFHSAEYGIYEFKMEMGDTLLLYSDGLSESRSGDEEFGTERINKLAELSYNLSPKELLNILIKNLNSFKKSTESFDDLTIMAIKRSPDNF